MEQIISELLGDDHESLADLLGELQLELGKHEPKKTFELLDLCWARLAVHIRAENLCLFPAILDATPKLFIEGAGMPSFQKAKTTIESLRADHNFFMDQLAQAVKMMRAGNAGGEMSTPFPEIFEVVRDRVTEVTARLVAHNRLEEEQVYQWPVLLLTERELETLSADLQSELENMPPRFGRDHMSK